MFVSNLTSSPTQPKSKNLIFSTEEAPPSIPDLILSLQQATFMAQQLPSISSTTNPTPLHQIHSSLHHAHRHLSAFLAALPPPADGAAPMQVEGDEETTSKCIIDMVEQKMRHCFIKNKRLKRPLSPSSTAAFVEEKRLSGDGFVERVTDYDPYAVRLMALDLLYQFHV